MTEGFDRKSLAAATPLYVHRCIVRFQDSDAAGMVFFARVFEYFHDAYFAFMAEGGMPPADIQRERVWSAPIRHAEADFVAPTRFGDALEVGLVKATWDASNLTLGYRITAAGRVTATGRTEHVIVDCSSMARITPPSELRALFRVLESA